MVGREVTRDRHDDEQRNDRNVSQLSRDIHQCPGGDGAQSDQ